MISQEIHESALGLIAVWSGLSKNFPRYALDFSWPSVGMLDLLLRRLFDAETLSEQDEGLLFSAAAYLTVCADLSAKAVGEKNGPEHADVLAGLRNVILHRDAALRTFAGFQASPFWTEHRVSLFARALLANAAAPAEGTAPTFDPKAAGAVVKHLAESSAKYYESVHPSEPAGGNPKLYFYGLILPPLGFEEDFFGGRSAFHLAQAFRAEAMSDEVMAEAAGNLALSPDPQISAAGYSVAAALAGEEPSAKLLALSDSLGPERVLLKQAVALARKAFGRLPSLPSKLDDEPAPELEFLLQIEQQLGLLPLWRISYSELVTVPRLAQFVYWNRPSQARAALDEYASTNTLTPALILQGMYLDFASANFERAKSELQDQEKNRAIRTIADPLLRALRSELVGSMALVENDLVLSEAMFRQAAAAQGLPHFRRSELLSLHGECLLALGRQGEALDCFESATEHFPNVSAKIGRIRALKLLRPDESREADADALVRVAPRHPEAFNIFRREKLLPGPIS